MQRRKFLQLFGIGLGTAAIPAATAAKATLTPPTNYDKLGSQPRDLPKLLGPNTNPCKEIPLHAPAPFSCPGPKLPCRTISIAPGQHAHILNTTTGGIHTIFGGPPKEIRPAGTPTHTYTLDHDEVLLGLPTRQTTGPKPDELPSIQKLIRQHKNCQEYALNGDSYGHNQETKAEAADNWQRIADKYADQIEHEAKLLGYTTNWPGLYPEFTQLPTHLTHPQIIRCQQRQKPQ